MLSICESVSFHTFYASRWNLTTKVVYITCCKKRQFSFFISSVAICEIRNFWAALSWFLQHSIYNFFIKVEKKNQIAHLATLISKQKPSQKKLLFSSYKQIGDEGISDVPSLFASGAFQLFNTMQHYIISRDNIRCVSFRINHFECLVNGIFSKFSSLGAAKVK